MKILLPVLPSDRFYDAVVAAGDVLAREGGTITFLFPTLRPPPLEYENYPAQHESELDVPPEGPYDASIEEMDRWRELMIAGLEEARGLLAERGVSQEQLGYLFADQEEDAIAEGIADEAAGGAYDLVVMSRGEFLQLADIPQGTPEEIAAAVGEWRDDGVRLLVT